MNKKININYEDIVKKHILYTFINQYSNQLSHSDLLELLFKIISRKEKAIQILIKYVESEVESKERPIKKVLNNISMFAILFARYINKNDEGVWLEGYSENKPF